MAVSRLSPGRVILGQRVRIRDREFTVVGICSDFVDSRSGLREIAPQIYTSSARTYSDFVVRTIGDPERVLDRVLGEVHQRESAVTARGFTYDGLRRTLSRSEKANAQFLVMVVVCAIVTCGFGLYSGVSELLRKNRRAVAIRLALGATTSQVLMELARSLFLWVMASSVLGGALALGMGTLVTAYVPNSGGNQIGNLAACTAVMMVAAALALMGPLRMLARTDLAMLARTEP
jgi:predicted lysophospholipase L1 biosynthesis ABC-type transport system permease subunit